MQKACLVQKQMEGQPLKDDSITKVEYCVQTRSGAILATYPNARMCADYVANRASKHGYKVADAEIIKVTTIIEKI